MTYYIALAIGLGDLKTDYKRRGNKVSAAFVIAWADAYTDHSPMTQPITSDLKVLSAYHFRVNKGKTRVTAGSSAAKEPVNDAIKAKDLMHVGIGLHAYQDSWSHATYTPAGHVVLSTPSLFHPIPVVLPESYYPDDPSRRGHVKIAMDMAEATYDVLKKYMKVAYGKDPSRKYTKDRIMKAIKLEFERGRAEQRLEHATQVRARVGRWRRLLNGDFAAQVRAELPLGRNLFPFEDEKEPWTKQFNKAASAIKPTYTPEEKEK